jgi:GTP-binding protein
MMACKAGEKDGAAEARRLFSRDCFFVVGVASYSQMPPPTLDEIAFAGRSNVGKSSLINGLLGRKNLARSSNTPGRTRQINFFDLSSHFMLVDLPGYGFAKAPKAEIRHWTQLVSDYLQLRSCLRRVCLLLDARHDIKPSDVAVMSLLDQAAVSYMIVMTKADKVSPQQLGKRQENILAAIVRRPAAFPSIIATSAITGMGLEELRMVLAGTDPLFGEVGD